MKRFDPDIVTKQVAGIAEAVGVEPCDARVLAESLVDADIHGISTHGVSRVDIYVRRIQKGLIQPNVPITVDRERASVLAVDAGNGIGQVQAVKVFDRLTDMAHTTGTASATIRNSQHFGALSHYCNKAAKNDMILIAMTNSEPAMAPTGGYKALFGTNPMGASFPTGKGYPVRVDLATSVVARGNVIAANKEGRSIPEGWALDENGNPTTDAEKALLGTVLTLAGHKGYALALMIEVFSSVLSGSAVGPNIGSMYKNMDRKQDVGHFFCLLDISAFMDVDEFKARMDETIDTIKASPKRPGFDEILVPGELEHRKALENRKNGIPVGDATVLEFKTLCEELGLHFML